MKVLAAILVILSILIILVPILTDCQSQGLSLTLENGKQVPMKCHWTAIAEIGLGTLLLFLGIFLFISKVMETRVFLGILGVVLGILIILYPTVLIGVCVSPDHYCNLIMKPFLILAGSLVSIINLIVALTALTGRKNSASS